jgi:VWFA-related protein
MYLPFIPRTRVLKFLPPLSLTLMLIGSFGAGRALAQRLPTSSSDEGPQLPSAASTPTQTQTDTFPATPSGAASSSNAPSSGSTASPGSSGPPSTVGPASPSGSSAAPTRTRASAAPAGSGASSPKPAGGQSQTDNSAPLQPAVAKQGGQAPYTIVKNVNLVNLAVTVEKGSAFVPGLTKQNFEVYEDGRPQTVKYFAAENQLPITLGWLIDTSPSQTNVLAAEQGASDEFFQQVLGPKDLAFVVGFDVDVNLLQDLTSSKTLLEQAIDNTHIGGAAPGPVLNPGPFPTQSSAGATHLWDAIIMACQEKLDNQVGRKALIVVTDGVDEGSSASPQEALRAVLDSNAVLYAIVASDPGAYGFGGFGFNGGARLRAMAAQSGGRAFNVKPSGMQKAFEQIASELRTQYSLGYISDRPMLDGTYRKLKVKLVNAPEKGLKVRARDGYWAEQTGS